MPGNTNQLSLGFDIARNPDFYQIKDPGKIIKYLDMRGGVKTMDLKSLPKGIKRAKVPILRSDENPIPWRSVHFRIYQILTFWSVMHFGMVSVPPQTLS